MKATATQLKAIVTAVVLLLTIGPLVAFFVAPPVFGVLVWVDILLLFVGGPIAVVATFIFGLWRKPAAVRTK